jgi:uncharacterized protein YhdP
MSSTVQTELHRAASPPPSWQGLRLAGLVAACVLVFTGIVVLAYEFAVARVPQNRAALERLVRAQTGLDIRFDELGLRWGWYGPEAVFRRVELGEPGRSTVLLRAPELVVGFDVWQTLRSGQLEAGRITLVAADVDLTHGAVGGVAVRVSGGPPGLSAGSVRTAVDGIRILEGWRGGRVDLEGGILRLADPGGSANPLVLQVRHASLRRAPLGPATSEWSGYGLVFLPERLGRTARLVMRLDGDLERPAELSGTVRFEGRRLAFGGWRDLLVSVPDAVRYLPRAGGGDLTLNVDFAGGRIAKANGKVSAGGLEFAAAAGSADAVFNLDHLQGEWQLAGRPSGGWRVQARVADASIAPPQRNFTLSGLSGEISGGETGLIADLKTGAARLDVVQAPQYPLENVHVDARLRLDRNGGTWRVSTEKFELQHEAAHLHMEGSLVGANTGGQPEVDAQAEVSGLDVLQLKKLAGAGMAQSFGATFSQLTAGRIQSARVDLRGPLNGLESGFAGSILLRDAVLAGGGVWPDAREVDARIDWRGSHVRAFIEKGHAGAFSLSSSRAEWDARGERAAHIAGHVTGPVEEALAWMRTHPALQRYAPRVQNIEMSGAATLEFSVTLPPGIAPEGAATPDVQARVTAILVDARLQAFAGMPSMESLHGSLVFDSGSLRRSALTGTWLGGPVTLNVGERREHGALVLSIQGRGTLDARHLALAATAGTEIDQTLAPIGTADWSGEISFVAGNETPPQWRLKADSSLVGVVSHLPEPLMKAAGAAVPLHVEAQGSADSAQLRLNLGDRFRSLLALIRHDDSTWQVERGNVQLGTTTAVLPIEPLVLVEGRVNRLELPAYVAAWQQLRREPAAPPIRANLLAGEMLVAGRGYPGVRVLAERTDAGADLQLVSPDISGTAHWPAVTDPNYPAQFHFTRLNVPDGGAFGASAELIAALGPATVLSVDEIVWEGHSLGSATATIESGGNAVNVTDLRLTDSTQEVKGTLHCQSSTCRLRFNLDSTNAAATLEEFGFRPELTAAKATVDGDLAWQVATERPARESPAGTTDRPALATLAGRLNLRLEDGITRADRDPHPEGTPFALLLVPALVSGMDQGQGVVLPTSEPRGIRFSRLEGDFELRGGEAETSNLHFDGDAEILMRGRTGLVARDYDQQVWILRGEGRLPAAVRRLGPTPRVAAAWLSLRDLFAGGEQEDKARAALHLQGTWDDPIVVASD